MHPNVLHSASAIGVPNASKTDIDTSRIKCFATFISADDPSMHMLYPRAHGSRMKREVLDTFHSVVPSLSTCCGGNYITIGDICMSEA